MSRRTNGKRRLEMDAERRKEFLSSVHDALQNIAGVAFGFGRNFAHIIRNNGRRRAVCDVHVVLSDGRVFDATAVSASPSSVRRAVLAFMRRGAERKGRRRILPPGKSPREVAEEILRCIDPEYQIVDWRSIGTNQYRVHGNTFQTPYSWHDLLQVSHPVLGLSPHVELESLLRNHPPRDPFAELRTMVAAHALVHRTYEPRVSVCGFFTENGRSVVQVSLPKTEGKSLPRCTRLMQSVRVHERRCNRTGAKIPFLTPKSNGGFVVGLLLADLPRLGFAVKIGKTSRTRLQIAGCYKDRGYNFLWTRVLRHAVFEDEVTARDFDRRLLTATADWKIEVPPAIAGCTEFRDFEQLTKIIETFEGLRKEFAEKSAEPATVPGEQVLRPRRGRVRLPGPPATPVGSGPEDFGEEAVRCAVCGSSFRVLSRHVRCAHQMTPGDYRARFDIPDAKPLTAAKYSDIRREIARSKRPRRSAGPTKSPQGTLREGNRCGVMDSRCEG